MAGWFLLVLGVLITGVWGASRWWWVGYWGSEWGIGVGSGMIDGVYPGTLGSSNVGWSVWTPPPEMQYWRWSASDNLRHPDRFMHMCLWPFALASLLGGGWLVWSGRRARKRAMTGVCGKCGYDLAGLAAGSPCPECGDAMNKSVGRGVQ